MDRNKLAGIRFGDGFKLERECIFCEIGSGNKGSDFLYIDESVFVIKDINPHARIHLLVIPRHHFTFLTSISLTDEPMIGHLFTVAQQMAKDMGIAESGYRLLINQGEDASQTIPHLHLHLLGGHKLGRGNHGSP